MIQMYEHLPEKVKAYHFKGGSFISVKECPRNDKKPCQNEGPCCLGCNRTCPHNDCSNLKALDGDREVK